AQPRQLRRRSLFHLRERDDVVVHDRRNAIDQLRTRPGRDHKRGNGQCAPKPGSHRGHLHQGSAIRELEAPAFALIAANVAWFILITALPLSAFTYSSCACSRFSFNRFSSTWSRTSRNSRLRAGLRSRTLNRWKP